MKKLLTIIVICVHVTATCSANSESTPKTVPSATTNETPDLTPEETKTVIKLLKACDSTLATCEKANKDKEKVIQAQQEQINAQIKQTEELKSDANSIWNSKLLWFSAGTVLTGVLVFLVKTHN